MSEVASKRMTVDDYLICECERQLREKHEFFDGEVRAEPNLQRTAFGHPDAQAGVPTSCTCSMPVLTTSG